MEEDGFFYLDGIVFDTNESEKKDEWQPQSQWGYTYKGGYQWFKASNVG